MPERVAACRSCRRGTFRGRSHRPCDQLATYVRP